MPDRDPWVLVGDAPAVTDPWAGRGRWFIGSGHCRPSSHAAGGDGRSARLARRLRAMPMTDPTGPSDPAATTVRPASEPIHEVDTIWDARIPARDGVELSANLWLPRPAPGAPGRFPAVLEMIPYGKDHWRRNAD